jgi:hypothetical protein
MIRLLSIAVLGLLACSAARAHPDDVAIFTSKTISDEPRAFTDVSRTNDVSRTSGKAPPGKKVDAPVVGAAPEFHAAGAVAALTLLLGGVAVLKGWRRE